MAPYFLSRTGEHFYGVDSWSGTGRPLLEVLSDKGERTLECLFPVPDEFSDYVFFQALSLFPHVDFYANAVNDTTVPYVTAALEPKDPFMAHETNGITMRVADVILRRAV